MNFSDKDLGILKKNLEEVGDFICQECGLNQQTNFQSLIARLEAAEEELSAYKNLIEDEYKQTTAEMFRQIEILDKAWRKSKGEIK